MNSNPQMKPAEMMVRTPKQHTDSRKSSIDANMRSVSKEIPNDGPVQILHNNATAHSLTRDHRSSSQNLGNYNQ